ncbi:MAG TPA: hypothetical protein VGH28_34165 [Polyangiaceae bacterium]
MKKLFALLAVAVLLLVARRAEAIEEKCSGPDACCPAQQVESLDHTVTVKAGVVLLGISNVTEKSGTWDADFYLYETWPPTPGFTPRTEVVNEVVRQSVSFDDTDLRDGTCIRSRRIHSTLRSEFNLRAFPFDHQTLTLQLSDNEFDSKSVLYAPDPYVSGLDDAVRTMVSGWHVRSEPKYARTQSAFKWEPGAPSYDYATFTVTIARHVSFHLTRYFLPLILIVVVAFSAFWIDPEDLGSQMQIGVTCLLAAIALQFAEGGTLPEVSYLTLADRCYAVCYVAIAAAIVESISVNSLVRRKNREGALRLDRVCRRLFPVLVVIALAVSIARSFA